MQEKNQYSEISYLLLNRNGLRHFKFNKLIFNIQENFVPEADYCPGNRRVPQSTFHALPRHIGAHVPGDFVRSWAGTLNTRHPIPIPRKRRFAELSQSPASKTKIPSLHSERTFGVSEQFSRSRRHHDPASGAFSLL